jgi:hypothetical protein
MSDRTVDIPLDAFLHDRTLVPRAGGVALPIPLWDRLDGFVARVNALGGKTNRHELLAAWICAADPVSEVLKEWVEAYRVAEVRDFIRDAEPTELLRSFAVRTAGRPRGT